MTALELKNKIDNYRNPLSIPIVATQSNITAILS